MPDLRTAEVTAWLKAAMPASSQGCWPPLIRAIETANDLSVKLGRLGDRLDTLAATAGPRLSSLLSEDDVAGRLRSLLAQLGAARLLRIMHWIGDHESSPDQPAYAALLSGNTPEAAALRASLSALTRALTLERIFSLNRLAALQAASADGMKEVH